VEQVINSTGQGIGSAELSYLYTQPLGRNPVVVIPVSNEFPSTQLTAQVALGPQGEAPVQAHIADIFIIRHQVPNGVFTVIQDD
jgi:hypothetical protein